MQVTVEAITEPQLPEDPQEGANGHNTERRFLNLIKKWDFKVIAAGIAPTKVTGRKSAKIDSGVEVPNSSRKIVFSN